MKARISVCLSSGVVLGLAGKTTHAQVDITTGRIVGTVVDADGQPLPGARIAARSKATGLTLTGLTDVRGTYRIVSMPVGTYSVLASLSGFGSQSEPSVVITLGSAPTVDFKLRLAPRSEAITIIGEVRAIETTQTASQTTIDNNAIRSLPINGRNFTDFVLLAPNSQKRPVHGNIQLAGQRGINTSATLDGVDYNDAFFGGSSGDGSAEGRAPFTVSQESVRELQVIENGASVEFGRSGGGFVNVVTKSGGNDFHGSAFCYSRPQSLTARFADGTDPEDQQTQQFGASIGGPVLRDRLFFFGAWDQQKQSTTIPITSSLVTDPDIAARYPKIGQTDTSYVQEQNGRVFFGRLDLQLGSRHRVYARANDATYDGLNGTSSSQTQSTSHNGVEGLTSSSYVASWNALFSPSLINDLNFQYARNDVPRKDKGLGLPEIRLGSDRAPLASFGEVNLLPALATDDRISIGDTVNFLAGAHMIKVGGDYNDTGMDGIFKTYWRGSFSSTTRRRTSRRQAFLLGRWTQYVEFLGLNGNTVDQAGRFDSGQKELAFFAQDQWYVTSSLTITAGLRYSASTIPTLRFSTRGRSSCRARRTSSPTCRSRTRTTSGRRACRSRGRPEGREKRRAPLPRPHFSRTPAILFSQLYSNNGVAGATYQVNANAFGPTPGFPAPGWGAAFNPNAVQQLGSLPPGTSVGAVGVWTIASDFKNPHTDRISLGAERELFGVAWGLEGIGPKATTSSAWTTRTSSRRRPRTARRSTRIPARPATAPRRFPPHRAGSTRTTTASSSTRRTRVRTTRPPRCTSEGISRRDSGSSAPSRAPRTTTPTPTSATSSASHSGTSTTPS